EPADALVGHAGGAHVLQPADWLLLRHRELVAAMVPPRGGPVHLHPRRREGAWPAAGARGDGGHRQPDEQDRLEEGVSRRTSGRRPDDGGRAAAADDGRWKLRGGGGPNR